MRSTKPFILPLILAIIISSCGDGAQGPAGINGVNGLNGNANVHSNVYTVSSWVGLGGGPYWRCDITDTSITQAILSKGAVLAYMGDSNTWNALPFANQNDEWRFYCQANNISIVYLHADGTGVLNPGTQTFKVVTIGGQ